MGVARRLYTPAMPSAITTTGQTSDPIFVGTSSVILGYFAVATLSGTGVNPTITARVDYLDDDLATVIGFAATSFTALDAAGGTVANIGPVNGGGFVIPNYLRIRFELAQDSGDPSWDGATLRLYGRNGA